MFAKLPYAQIAEWMCLIASILLIRKPSPKFWLSFTPYLLLTVLVEGYGYYMVKIAHQPSNHWVYNVFLVVYAGFHIWIFTKIIELKYIKAFALLCACLFLAYYIWEWNQQGFNRYFFRCNTLFGIMATIFALIYFYSLFKQEEYIPILQEPAFWFATGCLIFYATSTTVNALFMQIIHGNYAIRYFIITFLNVIMYSCWIKAFICLRKNQISTLR